jgi:hypothetical protein
MHACGRVAGRLGCSSGHRRAARAHVVSSRTSAGHLDLDMVRKASLRPARSGYRMGNLTSPPAPRTAEGGRVPSRTRRVIQARL